MREDAAAWLWAQVAQAGLCALHAEADPNPYPGSPPDRMIEEWIRRGLDAPQMMALVMTMSWIIFREHFGGPEGICPVCGSPLPPWLETSVQ